jgi:hypothetical protein
VKGKLRATGSLAVSSGDKGGNLPLLQFASRPAEETAEQQTPKQRLRKEAKKLSRLSKGNKNHDLIVSQGRI